MTRATAKKAPAKKTIERSTRAAAKAINKEFTPEKKTDAKKTPVPPKKVESAK